MREEDGNQAIPLSVHKDAWSQKDLLEGIVGRYLTVPVSYTHLTLPTIYSV